MHSTSAAPYLLPLSSPLYWLFLSFCLIRPPSLLSFISDYTFLSFFCSLAHSLTLTHSLNHPVPTYPPKTQAIHPSMYPLINQPVRPFIYYPNYITIFFSLFSLFLSPSSIFPSFFQPLHPSGCLLNCCFAKVITYMQITLNTAGNFWVTERFIRE